MGGAFDGKVALVTGAGSGIGRAIALLFIKEGARVAVIDIDAKGGKETVSRVEKEGGKAIFITCDVAKADEVQAMIGTTLNEFGRIDFACNNAGVHEPSPAPLPEVDEELFDWIINVNLKSVFLCMKYEIPQMLEQGNGVIVNTSSLAAYYPDPGAVAYSVSKSGIVSLTKSAAAAYANTPIRVNAVCPHVIETELFAKVPSEDREMYLSTIPMGRFGRPEEVASAVLWLCSDAASFSTGTCLPLNGGAPF